VCRLMVVDENGNQVKTENSEVKNYSLSVNNQNKLNLKITQADGKVLHLSGVVSCFSDSTCSVFKVRGNSYIICN
jgi:D-Tyr-tRNAtyr deacylase